MVGNGQRHGRWAVGPVVGGALSLVVDSIQFDSIPDRLIVVCVFGRLRLALVWVPVSITPIY